MALGNRGNSDRDPVSSTYKDMFSGSKRGVVLPAATGQPPVPVNPTTTTGAASDTGGSVTDWLNSVLGSITNPSTAGPATGYGYSYPPAYLQNPAGNTPLIDFSGLSDLGKLALLAGGIIGGLWLLKKVI